jgi:glycosyltransferase involved in cell wall biosynthesis
MNKILPITIIVPFFNEEDEIPHFFSTLEKLSVKVHSVLFVDSGSTDKSLRIIENYKNKMPRININIITHEGSSIYYPGKSRNVGIRNIETEWFAFLDVGVHVDSSWLETIWNYVQKNNSSGAISLCEFSATGFLQVSLCVLTNGYLKNSKALPGSIFNKEIFSQIDYFREDLRACEDIIFREEFLVKVGNYIVDEPLVKYSTYPENFTNILSKWYRYAFFGGQSGIMTKQIILYCIFFTSLIVLSVINIEIFLVLFSTYLICRGFILPIVKNNNFEWISKYPFIFIFLPLLAFSLDLSKFCGYVKYIFFKSELDGSN